MIRTKINGKHILLKEGQKKRRPGRHGVYNEDIPMRAYKLCLLGLLNKDLATAFGVNDSLIDYWIKNKPEFAAMVRKGRMEADSEIAYSLFKRATGYSHPDVDIKMLPGYKGEPPKIVKTEIVKHYPPDTTAAIFWLKNRTRRNSFSWADVNHIEHSGEVHIQQTEINMSEFTTEELKMLKSCGLKVAYPTPGQKLHSN